jgi:hypothetical protein
MTQKHLFVRRPWESAEQLSAALNEFAADGWRVISHAVDINEITFVLAMDDKPTKEERIAAEARPSIDVGTAVTPPLNAEPVETHCFGIGIHVCKSMDPDQPPTATALRHCPFCNEDLPRQGDGSRKGESNGTDVVSSPLA